MKQVMCYRDPAGLPPTNPSFDVVMSGVEDWKNSEGAFAYCFHVILATCVMTDFYQKIDNAPGGSATRTNTIRVNGSPSAMALVFGPSDVEQQDTTHSLALLEDDLVNISTAWTSSPAPINNVLTSFALETVGSRMTQYFTGHCGLSRSGPPFADLLPCYRGLLNNSGDVGSYSTDIDAVADIMPLNGTVLGWAVALSNVQAGPNTVMTFTIFKNGVAQDGTGGTPDTVIHIDSVTGTTGVYKNMAFAMPFVIGDELAIQLDVISGLFNGTQQSNQITVLVESENEGESIWVVQPSATPANTDLNYQPPLICEMPTGSEWTGASLKQVIVPANEPFALKDLTSRSPVSVGSGTTRHVALMNNGAATALTIAIVAPDTTVVRDTTHLIAVLPGDLLNYRTVADGTPTSVLIRLAMVQYIATPILVGTLIVQKTVTPVDSPQAFDFEVSDLTPHTFALSGGETRVFPDVDIGTYAVSEVLPPGWRLVSATTSNDSPVDAITIAGGEVVTATFRNAQSTTPVTPSRRFHIRRLRRTAHLSEEQTRIFYRRLQLDMQTGVGLISGFGSDPQLMLRWSNDGGRTWSNEHWITAGRMGTYSTRAIWRRLGQGRDRVFELVVSDPVAWRIVAAYLDVEKGTN